MNITGAEIDMVVTDSLKALELYEKIFEIKRVEVSNFPQGQNEAVFTIYDMRIHMLDENPEFMLFAPKEGSPTSTWFNIAVPSIEETFDKAIEAGCTVVQDIVRMEDFGVSNAIFTDPFGYMWMLHQIHKIVSHEDRIELFEKELRIE